MGRSAKGAMEVEAELRAPAASCKLVHYHFAEPPDSKLRDEEMFRIELCLTSRHRSARACYSDYWNSHRFERVGDLFLVLPGATLLARSDEDDSMTSIVCQLEPTLIFSLLDKSPGLTEQHLACSLDIRDMTIRSILLRLAAETKHPGFASEMLVEMLAGQMAIELVRYGNSIVESRARGGLAPWQLRLIDERLREVGQAPTLSELSVLCRVSVRQLTRGFSASRGCSIGAYVASSQMEHAKRLLATDDSVSSIAYALGFSSSSNFCYAFRRAIGLTPRQFRQRLLRPE